ncbi:MAG: hydrogenase iron-sulfur subunit [Thermodesulfobacteriaceae bacterium]|nr:hydrogenase iron-sulfur subunit [Thermodesulfobacteriaceae bacterium]
MGRPFKICILCCNYTNLSEREDLEQILGAVEIKRFPCSGHIEITHILRAFREGAVGVMVAGCERGTCHNGRGSERAEKKVIGAKKILEEIGMEGERVGFFFIPRLSAEDFVNRAKEFYGTLIKLEQKERAQ